MVRDPTRGQAAAGDALVPGAIVLIEGPMGSGRTTALAHHARAARLAGRPVAAAAPSPLERDRALSTTSALLDQLEAGADESSTPDGRRRVDREPTPPEIGAVVGRISAALTGHADGAPVVLVDDLPWCDPASRTVLALLARRLSSTGMTLVVAGVPLTHPDPASAELRAVATRIDHLEPLGLAEVAAAAGFADLSAPAVDAVMRATGGRALLVHEVAAALKGSSADDLTADDILTVGAEAVRPAIEGWLRGATVEARALARTAAALGDGTRLTLAGELAELAPEAIERATAELVDMGVLRDRSGRVVFCAPVVIRALAPEPATAWASALQRRAVDRLIACRAPEEEIVAHLVRTDPGPEPDPGVGQRLREAARRARASGDTARAVRLDSRALVEVTEPDARWDLLWDTARAEMLVDRAGAVDRLTEVLALTTDPGTRSEVSEHLVALQLTVDPAACRQRITRLEGAGLSGDRSARLDAHRILLDLIDPPHPGRPRPLTTEQQALVSAPSSVVGAPGARMQLASLAYDRAVHGAPAREVIALAEAALGDDAIDVIPEGPGPFSFAQIALTAADAPSVPRRCDEWDAAAARTGSVYVAAAAATHRAALLRSHGRLEEASAMARLAGRMTRDDGLGGSSFDRLVHGIHAEILVTQGRFDEAASLLGRIGAGPASTDLHGRQMAHLLLIAEQDDLAGAIDGVTAVGRRCVALGWENASFFPWRLLAAVLLPRTPDGMERARALVTEELASARRWGAPRALGRALWIGGTLAPGDVGWELIEEGCDLLADTPYRFDHAGLLMARGRRLRQAGRRAQARATLREALSRAEECGRTALDRRIRRELAAAGARPRRASASGPAALTPQERRLAGMVVAGATNREIAGEVFLSLRTVEFHLSNAYRKLGITSRAELRTALV